MNITNLKTKVESIINLNYKDNEIASAELFAFKSTLSDGSNSNIQLNYEIYNTLLKKESVIENVQFLLKSFKKKYLDKDCTFSKYSITNSKDVVDYFKRKNYDFKNEKILNGTDSSINPSTYKVEYFLKSIDACDNNAKEKKDYRGLKYSILKMTTKKYGNIYILNKSNPLYQPKNILYSFIEGDAKDEKKAPIFSKLLPAIFRLPTYPSMIIFDDYCFFVSNEIESIFGFEEHNKSICSAQLLNLKNGLNFNDEAIKLIDEFSSKKQYYNLFSDFDDTKLNKLLQKDDKTLKFINDILKIHIDKSLNCNIKDKDRAELLLYFLTNSIKKDPITSVYYFVRNSKPITI